MPGLAAMPDDPESSMGLLRLAQAGDRQALDDLLARYLPRLQRWASGRLPIGIRTMNDTADIVQEAVINALRNFNGIEIRTEGALPGLFAPVGEQPDHRPVPAAPPASEA